MANEEHLVILKQGAHAWDTWRTRNAEVDVDLSEADLREVDLSRKNHPGGRLFQMSRDGKRLVRVNLSKANLSRANLVGARFHGVDLSGAAFLGAHLLKADLTEADLTGAFLSQCDLSEGKLIDAILIGTHLEEACLHKADLSGANLSKARLYKADLSGANLSGANLEGAYLWGANLSKAILTRANLASSDLTEAYFHQADLTEAKFSGARVSRTTLSEATLIRAYLSGVYLGEVGLSAANLYTAFLDGADLTAADLHGANLHEAFLDGANLANADLRGADLHGADLSRAILVETDLRKANLTGCVIYGISAWGVQLDGARQTNLVITPDGEPVITVDNLEVAQFIYLLLHNEKIRDVINTIGKKGVLILGRFTERKDVLEAIRAELRSRDYVPIVFDFERPTDRDFTETVMTLAGMCLFIVADLSKPRSVPLELQATVPHYMIPFVPIIQEGEDPFAMFGDLWRKHRDWVVDLFSYRSVTELIDKFDKAVVKRALRRHKDLEVKKAEELIILRAEDF